MKQKGMPEIKKKISSFLLSEEGKIAKSSLLKGGALLAVIALGPVISSQGASAAHGNSLSLNYNAGSGTATAQHSHHASHSSHGSHASHSSHSSLW